MKMRLMGGQMLHRPRRKGMLGFRAWPCSAGRAGWGRVRVTTFSKVSTCSLRKAALGERCSHQRSKSCLVEQSSLRYHSLRVGIWTVFVRRLS